MSAGTIHRIFCRLKDLPQRLAQMRAGPQQSRLIVDDQVDRDVFNVIPEAPFIFKPTAETGGSEELKEARHDAACDINPAEAAEC